jgi:hypothetical protein
MSRRPYITVNLLLSVHLAVLTVRFHFLEKRIESTNSKPNAALIEGLAKLESFVASCQSSHLETQKRLRGIRRLLSLVIDLLKSPVMKLESRRFGFLGMSQEILPNLETYFWCNGENGCDEFPRGH